MTLTYGFYDSVASDRLYNAGQMGKLFDGIILDGVYLYVGDKFEVLEDTGMDVSVGTGRAWFNNTWTYNDAALTKTISAAHATLNRIDIIYLEVNEGVGVRANSIGVLAGTPASSPIPPTLTNTSTVHQYPLAHIYVGASVTSIVQANITQKIGTGDGTPWVTGILENVEWTEELADIAVSINTLMNHEHGVGDFSLVDAAGIENRNRIIWVPVSSCDFNGIWYRNNALFGAEFPKTSSTAALCFTLPKLEDTVINQDIQISIYYTALTNTGTVRFHMDMNSLHPGDSIGSTSYLDRNVIPSATGLILCETFSTNFWYTPKNRAFKLWRDHDNPADTNTGTIVVYAIAFTYLADS